MEFIGMMLVIYGVLMCFFGYKFFKFQIAIGGFIAGALIGVVVGVLTNEVVLMIICGIIVGLLGAWLSLQFYKLGVFMLCFGVSFLVMTLVINIGTGDMGTAIPFGLVMGIILGGLGVVLDKILIVAFTAIAGGAMVGISIGLMFDDVFAGAIVGVICIIAGLYLQGKDHKTVEVTKNVKEVEDVSVVAEKDEKKESINAVKQTAISSQAGTKIVSQAKTVETEFVLTNKEKIQWVEGLPIAISNVRVVSLDSSKSKVGLKFNVQSLLEKRIIGFYYSVECYDFLNNKLSSIGKSYFLDLDIGTELWENPKAIVLSNNMIRNCIITIHNVIFDDESIWDNDMGSPLRTLEYEIEILQNDKPEYNEFMLELYMHTKKNNISKIYKYVPKNYDDYWICSCGKMNINANCVECGIGKNNLFESYNLERLNEIHNNKSIEELEIDNNLLQNINRKINVVDVINRFNKNT